MINLKIGHFTFKVWEWKGNFKSKLTDLITGKYLHWEN